MEEASRWAEIGEDQSRWLLPDVPFTSSKLRRLVGLGLACVMRMRLVMVNFRNFVLWGVVAIVVFMVLLVRLLGSEGRARKNGQQQGRCKEFPHAMNLACFGPPDTQTS